MHAGCARMTGVRRVASALEGAGGLRLRYDADLFKGCECEYQDGMTKVDRVQHICYSNAQVDLIYTYRN